MNETDHPRSLDDLLSGRLDRQAQETMLAHLSTCDRCLARFEALWAGEAPETLLRRPPIADPGQAQRLEWRVLRQLHRDDLAAHMIGVSTRGLWTVIVALVLPLKPLLRQRTRA